MASYRSPYANYMSDKSGNHAPVGTILPVFADLNMAGNDPEYTYPQHLYCDGKSLNIRDYPELYSIIGTQYGGSASQTITQTAQAGGLRRSFVYNDKIFFMFYYDPTNNKTNVKRPYPHDSLFRFTTGTGTLGAFPTGEAFEQNTFYRIRIPELAYQDYLAGDSDGIDQTELNWINAQAVANEYAYYVLLPATVNMSLYNGSDYTKTFASPTNDTHPSIIVQKSFNLRDWPYNVGTFNLPDYRQRKILGFGNVNGAGTATPENAVNNFVGQTGGQWFIEKNVLIDSGAFFVLGDVKTTGYNTITADVSAYAIGSVKYQVGPMDDYTFPFPPAHLHRMLSVEVDQTKQAELGPTEVDKYAVGYIDSRANVNLFEPQGVGGAALGHSHGLIGEALQNSLAATYGNTEGVGERVTTDGSDPNYTQYLVSEAAFTIVTSMTYDAATDYITINTDGSHGLSIGDIVTVNGALPSAYSGNFTVLADGFNNDVLNVNPRDGETPASSPATGSITIKLANGYFVNQEVPTPPNMYVIDNNTVVGGKQVEFEIPGNAIILQSNSYTTPQAVTVNPPDASLGEVVAIEINLVAGGGGGADQDTDGQDGTDSSVTISVDGALKTIYVRSGDGGQSGNAGGAGGAGGILDVPAELLSDSRFQFTNVIGDDGDNGGMTGNGINDVDGGGMQVGVPAGSPTVGGVGTSIAKQQVNDGIFDQKFETNGSWSIPAAAADEISRTIDLEISGGGGGAGNANAGSNCFSTFPDWPEAITGKTGASGGYGGRGERITGQVSYTAGTFSWQLGQGGNSGKNERQGNTEGGTSGSNPFTGVPWNDWPGGIGNGEESGGATLGVSGAGGTLSGTGARGAWGNGGTAGSGGGVTGLLYNGTILAGAGGGGGGGGSGGGYNGSGTTDLCYEGYPSDATFPTAPPQGLIVSNSALDFANGAGGSAGSCVAGGGGGGGAGCGVIGAPSLGGSGGQAGIGHNGNGGGTGGQPGVSALRGDLWGGNSYSLDQQGALPTKTGYVRIRYSNVVEYFDPVGGGGGQGAQATIVINSINAPVYLNIGQAGQGGGSAGNGGNGFASVIYQGQEEGSSVPGDITSPAGRYYECDQTGNPTGSSKQGDVWISSTDPNIKPRDFGNGTGYVTGFIGGSNIPTNSGNQISRYMPFTGFATDSGGLRQLEMGLLDLTQANAIRFTVIRGSNQNGGENPDQALNVFYKKQGSSNTTLFSQILLATNNNPLWQEITLPIPESDQIRDTDVTLIFEQNRTGEYQTTPSTDDNYGLGAVTFFFDPTSVSTFISTGGATLQGNLNAAGQEVNADTGIDQVRREVTALNASLQINDGTFTMSSSTPITTTAVVTAENNIPLITKYHRVKYLIKAL